MKRTALLRKTPLKRTRLVWKPKPKPDWQATCIRLGQRSHGICEARLPGCTRFAEHPHHRKMKSQGGHDGLSNLLHVCFACHRNIHDHPGRSCALGHLIPSWEKVS